MSKRKQGGFTLLELVVVLAIAGVLVTLATLEFRRSNAKSAVENEARFISGELTGVRTRALFEKREIAVRVTGSQLAVYSSATVTTAPAATRPLRYPVTMNGVPDPMIFTSRGIIDGITAGSICIEPAGNDGAVDSVVVTTTRITTGKRNAAAACSQANIVIK